MLAKRLLFFFCFTVAVVSFLNFESAFSSFQSERTIIKLYDFRGHEFDGDQPVVFVGKLTTEAGERIKSAEILIKSDGPCPKDGIIASGFTDTYGRFWIYTITKIWDESDNMIKVRAAFLGNEKFSSSISDNQILVVYPSHAEKCEN